MVSTKVKGGIAVVLLIAATVFYIAGTATPSWSVLNYSALSSNNYYFGIWKAVYCTPSCTDWQYSCDSSSSQTTTITSTRCSNLSASRAFMVMACIVTPIAAVILAAIVFMDKLQKMPLLISKLLIALCLVFGIIGMIIGIVTTMSIIDFIGSYSISVSIAGGLSIIGVILNFFGLIASLFVRPV